MKHDGFLVECVLDTGQRLHSDPFGEFDVDRAIDLAKDLRTRAMVEKVYILDIATGEVVLEKDATHRMPQPTLVTVSAPRDEILLPTPWDRQRPIMIFPGAASGVGRHGRKVI